MAAADKNGRSYARLDELKIGDMVEFDDLCIDCITPNEPMELFADEDGQLYVNCAEGEHHIDGNLEDDGFLTGIYKVRSASTDAPESQGKQSA